MPTDTQLSPEDLEYLKTQGVDISKLGKTVPVYDSNELQQGSSSPISSVLKGHAGGILGGGAGALGTTALLAPWLAGPEAGIPADIAMILGPAAGALIGGYGGQKAQQAIQSPETTAAQQQAIEQAYKEHPLISAATDIGASALASGGAPTIATPFRAARGLIGGLTGKSLSSLDRAALMNVGIQSGINPAIQAGAQLATTGQLPSGKEMAESAIGGALFSKPSFLGRMAMRPTGTPESTEQQPETLPQLQPTKESPFTQLDSKGNYTLDNTALKQMWKSINPKPDITGMDYITGKQTESAWRNNISMPIGRVRDEMHNQWLAGKFEPETPPLQLAEKTPSTLQEERQKLFNLPEKAPSTVDQEWLAEQKRIAAQKSAQEEQEQAEPLKGNQTPYEKPTQMVITPEVLDKVIQNKAGNANAVKRIFPNLGLTDEEAQYILDNANSRKAGSDYVGTMKNEESDTDAYNRLKTEQQQLIAGGKHILPEMTGFHPEFLENWKQMEAIKNRNGGMPPEGTSGKFGIESEKNMPYGFWTSPEGTHIPVDFENHREVAQNLLERMGIQEPKDTAAARLELEKGYVRSVYDRSKNRLMVDAIKQLTNAQKRQIKNLAIEKNINASIYNNRGYGRTEDIHSIETQVPIKQEPIQTSFVPLPTGIGQHIANDKATVGTVLHGLAMSPNHPFAPLAKSLLSIARPEDLAAPLVIGDKTAYYPIDHYIAIHPNHLASADTVMEEMVHAMTVKRLGKIGARGLVGEQYFRTLDIYLNSKGGDPHLKDLVSSYLETLDKLNLRKYLQSSIGSARATQERAPIYGETQTTGYHLGSLEEFLAAAFHNREFQEKLNNIKTSDNRTIWQKIVDAVSHLLGIPVNQQSMLERVLRTGSAIISKGEEHAIQEPSTSRILPHSQSPTRETGSERGRVGQSNERETPTETSKNATIASSSGRGNQETKERVGEYHFGKIGDTFRSLINKIGDIPHPSAMKVSEAFHNVLNERQRLIGRWKNNIVKSSEDNHLTAGDKAVLARQFQENRLRGNYDTSLLQNQRQKNFYDIARRAGQDNMNYRAENKEPVIGYNGQPRLARQLPGYWPTMPNQKVAEVYRQGTDIAQISKLDKDFIDNQVKFGASPSEAQDSLKDFKTAMQGGIKNLEVGNQQYFNASRRAHGIPLPETFTEKDPILNLEKYFTRQALDNAHYKYVESNPEVMSALGEKRDAWGQPIPENPAGSLAAHKAIRQQLMTFHGEIGSPSEYNERSISGLATTLFIASPALETHKIISNIVGLTADVANPYQFVRTLGTAIKNIRSGYIHAVEGGVTRLTARSATDMFSGSATMAERMQGLARSVRHVASLGDITNRWGSALLQASYETIIPSKIARANEGDMLSQRWLRNIDPNYVRGKQYTEAEQRQLASVATNYVHGTADGRMLPGWMMDDSEISGFFSLAHWSVSQTNRFYSNILTPAMHGEIAPLLNSVFGMAVGGYLIKKVREELQGKKTMLPSLSEIANSDRGIEGNMGLLGYNLVAAAQYSGFGGILAQVAKLPFDFAYKNQPYGATFPLDETVSDLATTVRQATTALANDPNLNWLTLAESVTGHLLTQTFQLGRMSLNQGINAGMITGLPADKKMLGDKLNQLRRFDMVEGLPYDEIDSSSNPYMNLEQRRFKMTQNLDQAVKMIPGLINNIMDYYKDNPDVMMQKMQALKQNIYDTFPSMETTPLSFYKYLHFLGKEEGPEAAQAALKDYMMHKGINEAKSAIIP